MELKLLRIKNFGSFKDLDYEFSNKPILIQGENLTEPESQESNGSGKSFLMVALEYVLFKTTLKERESDLIFWGEDEAVVELSIHCPIRNQTLLIIRKIKLKGSSTLEIFIPEIDSQHPQSIANVNDGNNFIINWIGISKEDLQNYFILNKERYKSFFSSSNKEKVEMIARFSNAKLINGVDRVVQGEIDIKEMELKVIESDFTAITSKIETLKEQIQFELNRDLKTEIQEEIEGLSQQIQEYKTVNINHGVDINVNKNKVITHQKSLPGLKEEIEELNHKIQHEAETLLKTHESLSNLSSFNQDKDYTILDNKLSEIRVNKEKKKTDYNNLFEQSKSINEILSDISKNISGSVKCPKCSHEFLPGDPNIDIEEEKQELVTTAELSAQVQESLKSIDKDLASLEVSIKGIDDEKWTLSKAFKKNLEKITEVKTQVYKIEDKINGFKKDITEIEDFIKSTDQLILRLNNSTLEIEQKIKFNEQTIEGLKQKIELAKTKEIDHVRIKSLEDQIKEHSLTLLNVEQKVVIKKQEIYDTTQWITNFKRFDMFMANNSLKIIQGYCNKFLQGIKSDIQIRWEGVKVLADGKLRENITPYIIRNSETRSFWSFSGGERARIEMSIILTLQRMINATNHYGGLDLLCLDEVLESMDSLGLADIMRSLSELNKTIMITTHIVNRSIGDNILLVRKINGISQIVKN